MSFIILFYMVFCTDFVLLWFEGSYKKNNFVIGKRSAEPKVIESITGQDGRAVVK